MRGEAIVGLAGRQAHWEKSASIRSRPRRILVQQDSDEHLYPIARQPIALHPLVEARGAAACRYVLVQSLYKFLSDIAFVETKVVNRVAMAIADDELPWQFPQVIRRDALTVVIDEAYHAYVALDFIEQVRNATGIQPLPLPKTITIRRAIDGARARLPAALHPALEVVAVCIAENSVTLELININREHGLNRTFHAVNTDHMVDEVRHSLLFADVLKSLMTMLAPGQREAIGQALPGLLGDYLSLSLQKQFDALILRALDLTEAEVAEVIADVHLGQDLAAYRTINPIVDKVVDFLDDCGALADASVRQSFAARGLM